MVDVARAAGVSLKTVSRVVNGDQNVTAATIERVLEAATELRYERNDLAASLRSGQRSNTVGLIIEDVANPFYSAVAQAVEERAREQGRLLITASARESAERERELVGALMRRRVDALLVVPASKDHRYMEHARFGTPTVFLDRPPSRLKADTVLIDNRGCAARAVSHLIEHGHRRVAFVGDDTSLFTARERLAGYHDAHERAGIDVDADLLHPGARTPDAAREAARRLIALGARRRPTAYFSGNNRCTTGLLQVLGAGVGDAALVAFDDFELADVLGITVVRTSPDELGRTAADLAFARISGDARPPQKVMVSAELVTRGSGERPPR